MAFFFDFFVFLLHVFAWRSLVVVRCVLFVVRCVLLGVCCSCSLRLARCVLPCLLIDVFSVLCVVRWLSRVVCNLWFVVRTSSFGFCNL